MTETEMKWFRLGKLLRRNLMARAGGGGRWETLFEGDVTTDDSGYGDADETIFMVLPMSVGDAVRLTVNGESREFTVLDSALNAGTDICFVGNSTFGGNHATPAVNTDYDFQLIQVFPAGTGSSLAGMASFSSASAGTYHVKAERKIPVAYLYNGVRLPKLPDSELPYAYIGKKGLGSERYYINITSEKPTVRSTSGATYISLTADSMTLVADGDKWTACSTISALTAVWANADLYNSDGTLYLAASEPVPVYE